MVKFRLLGFIAILLSGIFFCIPFFNFRFIELVDSVFPFELNFEFWNSGLQYFGIELIVLSMLLFTFSVNPAWLKFGTPTLVLIFFIMLFQYSSNIPIHDDYWIILDFSNQYFFTDSLSEKFSLLISIWFEHRLVTTKILIITTHFLTDEVNIKCLILIANCCLPVILFLFYKSIPSQKYRTEITLIIALLLFQFGFYDDVVWATGALAYQLTILFLMLALFLIGKKSIAAQIASGLCAVLAALSFGNGWLIFPLAMLYFIIEKKWKLFFAWLVIACSFMLFYTIDSPAVKGDTAFFPLADYFIYSCCFMGGMFQFTYQLFLPFMAGFCVWILFAVITAKKYYKKNFFIYAILLFVILSSVLAAHFRLSFGVEQSISNRYGILSVLVLSAAVIAFFEILQEEKQKKYIPLFLFLALAFHLLSGVFFFPEVPLRKQKLERFIADVKNNKPYKPVEVLPEVAVDILKKSMERKIYFP